MPEINRRRLLQSFAAIPLFASLKNWGAWDPASYEAEAAHRAIAIQVMRFLNTAEIRYKFAYERYAPLAELLDSDVVDTMVYSGSPIKAWGGRELYEQLHFDGPEIVPGWRFRFALTEQATGYLITETDTSTHNIGAVSTDEIGIIYLGTALAGLTSEGHLPRAGAALVNGTALGTTPKPRGIGGLLAAAFRPVTCNCGENLTCCTIGGHTCCCDTGFGCCSNANQCVGACSECNNSGVCCNCGCGNCAWSCDISGCSPPC